MKKTVALFAALSLVTLAGCATSQATSLSEANRIRATRHGEAFRAEVANVEAAAATTCARRIEERARTYVRPEHCPACGPADSLEYYLDAAWEGAVTRQWYTGHDDDPRAPEFSDLRRRIVAVWGQDLVATMDRYAPGPRVRVEQGNKLSILITAATDACRAEVASW
mgnify:CR=1 FL=1